MARKLTQEDFITRAKEVHGNDRYNYSKTEYVNNKTKTTIICSIHGDFEQSPNVHLKGSGCPDCANESAGDSRKSNTEEFIQMAKEVHGDTYDYSKTEYVSAITKVAIICHTHGVFEQKAISHLRGHGCRRCGNILRGENSKKTTEEFIAEAKEVHGNDTYDYSKIEYSDSKTKTTIICHTHGNFEQSPNHHLSGHGCPKCGSEATTASQKLTQEQFIQRAEEIHNNKYDYSKAEYVNSITKVIIVCPEHGGFLQTPSNHLCGIGCPECANENKGWNRTKFINKCESKDGYGTLYVLECYNENEKFIKFGITSRSIEERYDSKTAMPYNYRILAECTGTPEMIWNIEKGLKRQMKLQHYVPQIVFGGHATECFVRVEEE